jgi:hypothetical protein
MRKDPRNCSRARNSVALAHELRNIINFIDHPNATNSRFAGPRQVETRVHTFVIGQETGRSDVEVLGRELLMTTGPTVLSKLSESDPEPGV